MKIALCDDIENDLKMLYEAVMKSPEVKDHAVELFLSGTALLEKIKESGAYDIVFLDVDMPCENGIRVGKQLKEMCPETVLIFQTGYPQYAIEGYECEALRYILKPVSDEKVKGALERAMMVFKSKSHYVTIKTKNTTHKIPTGDILYVECCRRHIIYHLRDRDIDTIGLLSDAYDALQQYGFCKVHQGYIVNMEKIYDFKGYDIILEGGVAVPVSVRKKAEVMKEYVKYLERH